MTGQYILDNEGNPVPEPDVLKWGAWFEKGDRRVARDEFGDVVVSTVFLGLDHAYPTCPGCDPQLYETMVFGGKHTEYTERCARRDEALAMHARAVALVKRRFPYQRAAILTLAAGGILFLFRLLTLNW